MRDLLDYSLLAHNTFGIDVKCARFVEYETEEEALRVAAIIRDSQLPLLIIGKGSNLLLTRSFPGLVVHSAIKGVDIVTAANSQTDNEVFLRCGSGETWDDVVAHCVAHQWHGMENLSLIPGEVGASAVQNIGAYGVEVCDLVVTVEAVEIATGKMVKLSNAACGYGYRQSRFKRDWKNRYLITYVTYRLEGKDFHPLTAYGNIQAELQRKGITSPTAAQLRQAIIDIRNEKLPDPKVVGNAGSFFMNPVVSRDEYERIAASYPDMPHYRIDEQKEKIPAGWLIEQCGWKGRQVGPAGVHDRQALVLVNKGGASGEDIVQLCQAIQRDVKERFGVEIVPEVNII